MRWELKKIKRSFELRKLECNLFLSYKNHEKKIEFDDLLRAISSFSKHSESKNEKILLNGGVKFVSRRTYDMRCRKLPLKSPVIIHLCKGF